LRELDASSNRLSDPLFDSSIDRLDQLEILDVRHNSLSSLESSPIVLSSLKQMLVSNNRLESLPSMAGWDALVTLLADSNRICSLHEDLFTIPRLRTFDISGNDIKSLDPRLGTMDSLETIKFDANPLAEIRLAGMSTPDLKKTLLGRLAPPTIAVHEPDDSDNESVVHYGESEAPKGLEVGRGGILDLSSKDYYELPLELLETVSGSPTSVLLSRNRLLAIPTSIEHFSMTLKSLDLSFNRLSSESYLAEKLTLPTLTTLVLQNTGINSFSLLVENLDAPRLDSLDVTANRITSIEGIRQAFGQLTTLRAADNAVTEIPVESVEGLRVLDLSGNSLGHLPPKLALVESLKELRVQGNLFRVPRWQILDKGTEAVMSWLRDKLTPEEGGEVAEEPAVD
jgi:Leucine-rich repeat (LRR) protein